MKRYNLVYYWQNFLSNKENRYLRPNSYVIKFCIVNKFSYDFFCDWYSFSNVSRLISFLRYVVIPSTYITKAFGEEENIIFLDALDKDECIDYIDYCESYAKNTIIKQMKNEYDFLNRVEKFDLGIKGIKKYIELINKMVQILNNLDQSIIDKTTPSNGWGTYDQLREAVNDFANNLSYLYKFIDNYETYKIVSDT